MTPGDSYEANRRAEERTYQGILDVHGLPPIAHYWSNEHLVPLMLPFGFRDPTDFFAQSLRKHLDRKGRQRFVSLGSGNCDLELALAGRLRSQGESDFVIECIDVNPAMLERGRRAAAEAVLSGQVAFVEGDLNTWKPAHEYDAVLANQSLHHVVELEHLLAQVRQALAPQGSFLISDMIGRNGHQRWPEALEIVHEFWRRLPPSYRVNWQLRCYEEMFEDWDSSVEGFEGIRSQDILLLLMSQFHFRFFFAFGNVIDPFIDRSFGPNFDPAVEWDRAFIDEVHRRDEEEFRAGRLKPTHLMAVAGKAPDVRLIYREPLSPEFSVRQPERAAPSVTERVREVCRGESWPGSAEQELARLCRRLGEFRGHAKERTARLSQLERELEARTAWALRLNDRIARLEATLHERTLLRLIRSRLRRILTFR